jgi:hypothetical protein
MAPELWQVMLVDEKGHAKGLPLNRLGGEFYGAAIAGHVLICQERRTSFSANALRAFTQEVACSCAISSFAGPDAGAAEAVRAPRTCCFNQRSGGCMPCESR